MMSPVKLIAAIALFASVIVANAAEARVYRDRVSARWSADGKQFWYKNDLPGDKEEFVLVDVEAGRREVIEKAPDWSKGDEPLTASLQVRPSARTGDETKISFDNRRSQAVELFWIDEKGERNSYG